MYSYIFLKKQVLPKSFLKNKFLLCVNFKGTSFLANKDSLFLWINCFLSWTKTVCDELVEQYSNRRHHI